MATIIWKESKQNGTAKSRYKARRAAMVAGRRDDVALARKVSVAASGCSDRVLKAVTAPSARIKQQPSAGSICMGDVAIYSAGFRTNRKDAIHIVK